MDVTRQGIMSQVGSSGVLTHADFSFDSINRLHRHVNVGWAQRDV